MLHNFTSSRKVLVEKKNSNWSQYIDIHICGYVSVKNYQRCSLKLGNSCPKVGRTPPHRLNAIVQALVYRSLRRRQRASSHPHGSAEYVIRPKITMTTLPFLKMLHLYLLGQTCLHLTF